MFGIKPQLSSINLDQEYHTIEDYQSNVPRWCPGCGDNAILAAIQRLCRDEQLRSEKTVFISGIGCSSRLPHYMKTYGFHGLHGRALPIAQGVKIRRPDLKVFVNMGDGDCCSIGTAHWIHAIRYNMNMVAIVHDNEVYGLTKMQASPTSRVGLRTNTTPRGSIIRPLNILSTTLGVSNVSFVANGVEWIPDLLYDIIKKAYHHHGFSFVRIMQRCPHFLPDLYNPIITDLHKMLILTHENGLQLTESHNKVYKSQMSHDPSDLKKAQEIAQIEDKVPIGILYQNEDLACYDEQQKARRVFSIEKRKEALESEFDKFAINPVVKEDQESAQIG